MHMLSFYSQEYPIRPYLVDPDNEPHILGEFTDGPIHFANALTQVVDAPDDTFCEAWSDAQQDFCGKPVGESLLEEDGVERWEWKHLVLVMDTEAKVLTVCEEHAPEHVYDPGHRR